MSVSVMRVASTWRRALALCALAVATLLTGCASGPLSTARDPLEPLNRQVYAFNEGADQLVVKPVATLYREGVDRKSVV